MMMTVMVMATLMMMMMMVILDDDSDDHDEDEGEDEDGYADDNDDAGADNGRHVNGDREGGGVFDVMMMVIVMVLMKLAVLMTRTMWIMTVFWVTREPWLGVRPITRSVDRMTTWTLDPYPLPAHPNPDEAGVSNWIQQVMPEETLADISNITGQWWVQA
eukprot:7171340-Karenia_brevis.AAC.1